MRLRTELVDDAPKLCAPFTELPEAGMGDAAALCESAHLLAEFRAAVLKLPCKGGRGVFVTLSDSGFAKYRL